MSKTIELLFQMIVAIGCYGLLLYLAATALIQHYLK